MKTLILTGPSASGKSALAFELAKNRGRTHIINADSLQVYRDFNIGTAKPTQEELDQIPHHLISITDPTEIFTAGDFVREAMGALEKIHAKNDRAIIVGGTGFYLKALLFGIWTEQKIDPVLRSELEKKTNYELFEQLMSSDPTSAKRMGPNDRYRLIRSLELITLTGKTPTEFQEAEPKEPNPEFDLWVLDRPKADLESRISTRIKSMLEKGLIEEVVALRVKYPDSRALDSVGYREVCAYLTGKKPQGRVVAEGIKGLQSEIELATRQLVKQQRTWIRGAWLKSRKISARSFELDRDLEKVKAEFNKIYGEKPTETQ